MKQQILLFKDFDFTITQDNCDWLKFSFCKNAVIETNKRGVFMFNKYLLDARVDPFVISCFMLWYPDDVVVECFDSAIETPMIELDEEGSNREVLSLRKK